MSAHDFVVMLLLIAWASTTVAMILAATMIWGVNGATIGIPLATGAAVTRRVLIPMAQRRGL